MGSHANEQKSKSSELEQCLDKEPNEAEQCLKKTEKNISIQTCYNQSDKIKSNYLKENFRLYCFYHISEFSNLKTCVNHARKFISADNHDAALYDCQYQFSQSMTKNTCMKLSEYFRIPEKSRYLKSHCETLADTQ